jgi:dTDP-4-dehydrorhamnose reductase
MKVLVFGANGQLGRCLRDTCPDAINADFLDRQQADLEAPELCALQVRDLRPDIVINAAAYTQVDKVEEEGEKADIINGHAVGAIAAACEDINARLIHVSTDFVFDGFNSTPYQPDDTLKPVNRYGESKALGEKLAQENCSKTTIVRTSWVYSEYGHNFLKTMLRVMEERDEVSVVCDQVGSPTYARNLAKCLWKFSKSDIEQGLFHYSDAGVASWYDFAVAIYEQGREKGLLKTECSIKPIPSSEYPLPAARPFYSVIDKGSTYKGLSLVPVHWSGGLRSCVEVLRGN